MGLFRGLWAPFRGAVFIARHRLWGHILLPLAVNVALAVLVGKVAIDLVASWLDYEGVLKWLAVALTAVLLFIFAQPIVAAPFVDALTEKVESIVRGRHPRVGFIRANLLAVWHGLLKSMLYGIALVVTAGLFFLTGVGSFLGTALTGLFLAYDGFDFPLARRVSRFRDKWHYLLVHPGQTLGYAVGASLLYLIPLAMVIAPPFAAVGATLAFLDAEGGAPATAETAMPTSLDERERGAVS